MKRFFTLIELIVVIVVLGVLAAIVIPNVSSFKEEAIRSEITSNTKNLQTASDRYGLKNNGIFPVTLSSSIETPQRVEEERLFPTYLSKKSSERGLYWLDHSGTVWGSMVDAPSRVHVEGNTINWEAVPGARGYQLYGANEVNVKGSLTEKTYRYVPLAKVGNENGTLILEHEVANSANYDYLLVGSIDRFGFSSVPVGEGYFEYSQKDDAMNPFPLHEEGTFFLTTNANGLATWDALVTKEMKPTGTQIKYSFATSNDGTTYTPYVDKIGDLPKSQYMRVKVDMIGFEDQLPTLTYLKVKFHLDDEEETVLEGPIEVTTGGFEQVIPTSSADYFRDVVIVGTEADYEVSYQSSKDGVNYSPQTFYPEQLPQGEYLKMTINTEQSFEIDRVVVVQTKKDPNVAPIESVGIGESPTGGTSTPPKEDETQVEDGWEVTSEFEIVEDATAIGDWISMEKKDTKPAGTEIDYLIYTSDNEASWSGPFERVEDAPNSRYLKVGMIFKRQKGITEKSSIQEMTINYRVLGKDISQKYQLDSDGRLVAFYDYINTFPRASVPDGVINITNSTQTHDIGSLNANGSKVVYHTFGGVSNVIQLHDVVTNEKQTVVSHFHSTLQPVISDNERFVIYRDDKNDSNGDVYTKDLLTKQEVVVDGTSLPAYKGSYNVNATGTVVTHQKNGGGRIIRDAKTMTVLGSTPSDVGSVEISPDGKMAYYVSGNQFIRMNLENGTTSQVAIIANYGSRFNFSVDGRYVLINDGFRNIKRFDSWNNHYIDVVTLPNVSNTSIEDMATSNDGDVIVYQYRVSGVDYVAGYRVSTGEAFAPSRSRSNQRQATPQISADGKVMTWNDDGYGGRNIMFAKVDEVIRLSN